MTIAATAPSNVRSLRDVLVATTWWAANSDAASVFYDAVPADEDPAPTGVWCVISNEGGGTYRLSLFCDDATTPLETLELGAEALRYQMPTRLRSDYTGIYIESVEVEGIGEPDPEAKAGEGQSVWALDLLATTGMQ